MKRNFLAMAVTLLCVIACTLGFVSCDNNNSGNNSSGNGTSDNGSSSSGTGAPTVNRQLDEAQWKETINTQNLIGLDANVTVDFNTSNGQESDREFWRIDNGKYELSGPYALSTTFVFDKDSYDADTGEYDVKYYDREKKEYSNYRDTWEGIYRGSFCDGTPFYILDNLFYEDFEYNDESGLYESKNGTEIEVTEISYYIIICKDVSVAIEDGRVARIDFTSYWSKAESTTEQEPMELISSFEFSDYGTTTVTVPTDYTEA